MKLFSDEYNKLENKKGYCLSALVNNNLHTICFDSRGMVIMRQFDWLLNYWANQDAKTHSFCSIQRKCK